MSKCYVCTILRGRWKYVDFGSKNVWVPSTAAWAYNDAHFIGWWWKLNKVMSIKCLAQCSLELPFREVSGDIAGLCLTRVRLLLHAVRKSLFLSVPQSSCLMQSFNLGLEFVAVFLIEQDNGQCSCHSFSMTHNRRYKWQYRLVLSKRKAQSFVYFLLI